MDILQAHGQHFLQSFALPADHVKKRKREEDNTNQGTKKSRNANAVDAQDDEYEEWTGIHDTPHGGRDNLAEDFDTGLLHGLILVLWSLILDRC